MKMKINKALWLRTYKKAQECFYIHVYPWHFSWSVNQSVFSRLKNKRSVVCLFSKITEIGWWFSRRKNNPLSQSKHYHFKQKFKWQNLSMFCSPHCRHKSNTVPVRIKRVIRLKHFLDKTESFRILIQVLHRLVWNTP